MSESSPILTHFPLDFQWPTQEPFLFCVHHDDTYPKGNGQLGVPIELLAGRDLGQDFSLKDGFRMYHGESVPGFPVHPHRGFETITIVRKGYIDHSDSMGAAGRYGEGDVQWMTAGGGVQHSEMFPLVKTDDTNQVELFQVWLNLPRKSKMVSPAFKMFWHEKIPRVVLPNGQGVVSVIAGDFVGTKAIEPPPNSWAARAESEVLILIIQLNPNGELELPLPKSNVSRSLFFFKGEKLSVNGQVVTQKTGFTINPKINTKLAASDGATEILILQAQSIGEPVVQYGPFVMNTKAEIAQTIEDYQRTQFGGWSWGRHDMVHGPKIERFAKYPDGHLENPT